MRGQSQHVNVGARAENAVLRTGNDYRSNFWVLEADALQGVVELDVHPQIIRIQLQFVAWANSAILRHVHRERRHRTIEGNPPVLVTRWLRLIIDRRRFRLRVLRYSYVHAILLL